MDLLTWSPNQSAKTEEICKHLTRDERWTAVGMAALFGLVMGGTWLGLLLVFACGRYLGVPLLICFMLGIAVVVTAFIVGMRLRAKQRAWLLSTKWARATYSQDSSLRVSDEP